MRQFRLAATLSVVLYPASQAVAATAADSTTETSALQEVVVTAQKRSEDIQIVPMSITAISAASLSIQGIHDFQDVLSEVPNLSFQYGTTANGMGVSQSRGITIRGISGANTTSFYINDTPVPVSIDPRILAIDHIEVLKGPQGTLYGEASMGGTVKIVTQNPSLTESSADLDVDAHDLHGGGAGTFDSVNSNVPLSSTAAARFGGYYSYEPGFLERTYNDPAAINGSDVPGPAGGVNHIGTQTSYGGFGTFRWEPESNFSVTPLFMVEKTSSNGFLATDDSTQDLVQRRALNVPEAWRDTFYLGSIDVHLNTALGTLTSASSYFYRVSYDQEDGTDVTKALFGFPHVVPTPSLSNTYAETLIEELRLQSQIGAALNTTLGAYFNDTLNGFHQSIVSYGANAASGGALGTDVGYLASFPDRSYEKAVFASGTYTLGRTSVTAGLRESWITENNIGSADGFFNGGPSSFNLDYSARALTPRVSLQQQISGDKMAYITASKGFRPGGTQDLPSICAADLTALGLGTGASTYKDDSLWNYEVGAKTRWLDGRFLANIALYDIEWTGIQEIVTLPTCGFTVTVNGAAARSQGSELELQYMPVQRLTLGISGGYEDAHITAVAPNSSTLYVGQPLNGVPRWTGTANATYEIPTAAFGKIFVRWDYNYVGSSLSLNTSPVIGRTRPSYTLMDARIGTTLERLELAAYVKNITDSRPNLGDEIPEVVALPDRPRYIIGPPRSVGLEARWRF